MDLFYGSEKKRATIGKTEWEALKKRHGNKCLLCGISEKKLGGFPRAHLKAHSRGGTQIVPICPNCHTRYDNGLCNQTELKKLGLNKDQYKKVLPKKKNHTNDWIG